MLFAHSEANPSSRRTSFRRSVSELSSHTIRIRAPAGTLSFNPVERLVLPEAFGVCVIGPIEHRPSFVVPFSAKPGPTNSCMVLSCLREALDGSRFGLVAIENGQQSCHLEYLAES